MAMEIYEAEMKHGGHMNSGDHMDSLFFHFWKFVSICSTAISTQSFLQICICLKDFVILE